MFKIISCQHFFCFIKYNFRSSYCGSAVIKPASTWILVGFLIAELQWEHPGILKIPAKCYAGKSLCGKVGFWC